MKDPEDKNIEDRETNYHAFNKDEEMENLDEEFENVGKGTEEIPISVLDEALKLVRETELDYTQKKKVSNEASALFSEAKEKFMGLLEASGKSRWDCEGVVGFTMYDKLKVRVPQSPADSEAFGNFLKSEKVSGLLGQESRDIFLKYFKVSSQSLGPLYKQLKELAAENGEDLQIPGLLPPTSEKALRSIPKKK